MVSRLTSTGMGSSWTERQSREHCTTLHNLLVGVRGDAGEVECLRDGGKGQSDEPRVHEERKRKKLNARAISDLRP